MKGDFSRDTFDASKHFSRVLMQQGRVQLDADWNEQASILLHYLQTLAADLIGPHAGPTDALGFEIKIKPGDNDLTIGKGRYYVDGILCENEDECAYTKQPDYYPLPDGSTLTQVTRGIGNYAVYLDVWERHVTYLDDDRIREVALGGPDTATRAKVAWQVKIMQVPQSAILEQWRKALAFQTAALAELQKSYDTASSDKQRAELEAKMVIVRKIIVRLQRRVPAGAVKDCKWPVLSLPVRDARMQAQVEADAPSTDPCITAPDSKYRGAENQLYRVEIHEVTTDTNGDTTKWTFKWSRDNGSIAAAIVKPNGPELTIYPARGFAAGQWVELISEAQELRGEPGALAKVTKVESDTLTVDASGVPDISSATKVRRWDQSAVGDVKLDEEGAVIGVEGQWLDLEHGLQVRFEQASNYRSGDYWLIPARVATGKIEWPTDENDQPAMLSARGVEHHYAPLAILKRDGTGLSLANECRCTITAPKACPE